MPESLSADALLQRGIWGLVVRPAATLSHVIWGKLLNLCFTVA